MVEQRQSLRVEFALDTHQILLVDRRILADQPACDAPILGQDQEAGRIDVQPASRRQALEIHRMERRRIRRLVLVYRLHQGDGRLEARFRLTRNVADRLVQEDRHLLPLRRLRAFVQTDAGGRVGASTKLGYALAVNEDPAALDEAVGLAPRTQAALGHQLGDAHTALRRIVGIGGLRLALDGPCGLWSNGCPRRRTARFVLCDDPDARLAPLGRFRRLCLEGVAAGALRSTGVAARSGRFRLRRGGWLDRSLLDRADLRRTAAHRLASGVLRCFVPGLGGQTQGLAGRIRHQSATAFVQRISSSSTSNTSVAFGGITPPAPRAP